MGTARAKTPAGIYFYGMAEPRPSDPGPGAVVFFDGVCALCNGFADFVLARDLRGRFRIAALQGRTAAEMGALAAQPAAPAGAAGDSDPWRSILLWDGVRWHGKSDAALRVIAGMGGAWRFASVLLRVPRAPRDAIYDFIARNRYRWFGKREACRLPSPAEAGRFLP